MATRFYDDAVAQLKGPEASRVDKKDRIPEQSMKLDLPLDGQSPFSGGGRPSRYSETFQGDDLK
ncbi:hypothetical protein TMEN_8453 [Trichophyton mentagrophytes]|nr:hypothetical protein TMEN_8453 [Trichophyton mentagrophytes]